MPGTLAIDLGSTTTVVAWQEPAAVPRLLELPPYSCHDPCVVPSLLWLSAPDQERPLIGRQVLEAGLADTGGPGLCRDFKRLIGAGGHGIPAGSTATGSTTAGSTTADSTAADSRTAEGPARAALPWLSPEAAGALLLQRLWAALPQELTPQRLVLTAPIETYRGYRLWLQQVSHRLNVPELALVDEPTAAAIGAGLPAGSRVLVVDMGGGTIDLSLVALEGGEGRAAPIAQLLRFAGRDLAGSGQVLRCARVIGKAGLPLGGRDIDRWIAACLCPGEPPQGTLLRLAEVIKCRLSDAEEALQIHTSPAAAPRELRLSRQEFEQLLQERGLIAQLDGLLEEVLAAARRNGLGARPIDAVLPVGGCSRIPLLRRWLAERLEGVPLRGERPVEAVALGALALTPGVRLKDVLSRGVSLRCWDRRSGRHHWHPLFVAGQPWPTQQPLELVLACSEDAQHQLELVLGEPVPENRSEVIFEAGLPVLRSRAAGALRVEPWAVSPLALSLSSPGLRGVDRLKLRFGIDADGQLVLEVEDLEAPAGSGPSGPMRLGPVR